MQGYFSALGITIAAEFLVYLLFIRRTPLKLLLYAVIINSITHPIAFYFYNKIWYNIEIYNSFNIYFLIIEIIVFLAEILPVKILLKTNFKTAVLISFSANLITASLSFVI